MLINIIEILIIFVSPITLWYFGVIKDKHRWWTFNVTCLIALAIILFEHWPLAKLGLRVDNFLPSFIAYSILTAVGIIVIKFTKHKTGKTKIENWWQNSDILLSCTFYSIFQEFAYRGFLMPKLTSLFSSVFVIVFINALLFILPHLIFKNRVLLAGLTFTAGIFWAGTYYYFPNLILIAASHMILNFMLVTNGFVKLNSDT